MKRELNSTNIQHSTNFVKAKKAIYFVIERKDDKQKKNPSLCILIFNNRRQLKCHIRRFSKQKAFIKTKTETIKQKNSNQRNKKLTKTK